MGLPQWRLASRLARREVRRRPGRTLLVVVLIAVPVFGMTVGSVLVHSHADADPAMRWWRPGTDIVVDGEDLLVLRESDVLAKVQG